MHSDKVIFLFADSLWKEYSQTINSRISNHIWSKVYTPKFSFFRANLLLSAEEKLAMSINSDVSFSLPNTCRFIKNSLFSLTHYEDWKERRHIFDQAFTRR